MFELLQARCASCAVLLTLALVQPGLLTGSDATAKDDYKAGEQLLKAGKPIEALIWFQNAAHKDPKNSDSSEEIVG